MRADECVILSSLSAPLSALLPLVKAASKGTGSI
jgi:hypothetical protein